MFNFKGKTALVTGGSKGIGRAIVEALAIAEAKVMFTYRSEDDSVESLRGLAKPIQSDSGDPTSYETLSEQVRQFAGKNLDILINNVGDAIHRTSFNESSDPLWIECLNLNLYSATRATRALLPHLIAAQGTVVNISSIAGNTTGAPDSLHYGTAKAALDNFTVGLAREMHGTGVRVNGVAPSAIDTNFQDRHSSAERLSRIVEQTPLGRVGTAQEVANVVCFLASNLASYVSGAVIPITGGR